MDISHVRMSPIWQFRSIHTNVSHITCCGISRFGLLSLTWEGEEKEVCLCHMAASRQKSQSKTIKVISCRAALSHSVGKHKETSSLVSEVPAVNEPYHPPPRCGVKVFNQSISIVLVSAQSNQSRGQFFSQRNVVLQLSRAGADKLDKFISVQNV